MEPFEVLLHPAMTEKNVGLVETENKLVFIVNKKSKKEDIKKAFEELFNVKVKKINTLIDRSGRKKALIKLKPEHSAADIAVKMGMI